MTVAEAAEKTLRNYHGAFPVTEPCDDDENAEMPHFGRLKGLVYSKDIGTKFFERFFDSYHENRTRETWDRYIACYPRFFWPHEVSILGLVYTT